MSDYFVIGGTGFIGSAITRGVSENRGTCVSLGSSDCDLMDPDACAKTLPDHIDGRTVVFAAGIPRARTDSLEALQANMAMVHNVVSAMAMAQPRGMVFLSSVEVYGVPEHLPVNEHTEVRPRTLYAVGKLAAELMLRKWHDETGVPLVVLRLPGVYGAGDGGHSLVGRLVTCAREGQPFTLAGEGAWRRDYVCVDDIARVVTALGDTAFDELTLNVATGHSLSIREVIDRVATQCGPVPLKAVTAGGPDGHLDFDVSQRQAILPGVELTGLEAGLKSYGNADDT